MGVAVGVGEDEGWASRAVDDAGGEDAEDAAVPVGVVEDEDVGGVGAGGVDQSEEFLVDGVEGAGFGVAASLVQGVEFDGEFLRTGGVAGEEELDYVGGNVHAAGGIDSGSKSEADFGCGGGTVERNLGELHQGAQARLDGVCKGGEADGGDGAVFSSERDGVGDGGDGDEFEEGRDKHATGAGAEGGRVGGERRGGFEEGLGEFVGDGGSAEVLVGVEAVGLGGVDDGEAVGKGRRVVGEMVVGDDEVEAEDAGFGGFDHCADAGVDRDDEADARGGGFGEDGVLHAVAFADAVWDMVGDGRGLCGVDGVGDALDGGFEQDGGGGAVNVVVSVDQDGFSGLDGGEDAFDGGSHAEELCGVVGGRVEEGIDARVEEGFCGFGG